MGPPDGHSRRDGRLPVVHRLRQRQDHEGTVPDSPFSYRTRSQAPYTGTGKGPGWVGNGSHRRDLRMRTSHLSAFPVAHAPSPCPSIGANSVSTRHQERRRRVRPLPSPSSSSCRLGTSNGRSTATREAPEVEEATQDSHGGSPDSSRFPVAIPNNYSFLFYFRDSDTDISWHSTLGEVDPGPKRGVTRETCIRNLSPSGL